MISRSLRLLHLLAAGILALLPAPARAQTLVEQQGSVNGLYPLWEQTAVLHPPGAGQIGYAHAQVGLGPVQVGTQPALDLQETFNLQLKVALLAGGRHRSALVLSGYRVPDPAEAGLPGDLQAPGVSEADGAVTLLPISLAHSYQAAERWQVHSTITGLLRHASRSGDHRPSVGLATLAAWQTGWRWSARFHAGLWGVGLEPQAHAGLSLAYATERVALAAGYALKGWLRGGEGVFLIDGALLFR